MNTKLQPSITWTQCAELPTELSEGKTTIINGKVYCGGGVAADGYTIYCYEPSQDKWTPLPPLPVRYFGLGQVNGDLVAVGGTTMTADKRMIQCDNIRSYEVATYNKQSQRWEWTIPPMPTARHSPGVLSLQSALVVAGGYTLPDDFASAVEIFKPDKSQWYRTDPLPVDCYDVSLATTGNTCYMLGGYKEPTNLNQALFASVDDLLRNAVPVDQYTHSDTQSAWKTLPNTPTYRPAAAVLAGHLIAVGGNETSKGGADKKEVYMYSSITDSWIYISNLPAPLSDISVNVLPSEEIIVVGGKSTRDGVSLRVNTVYKGTLHQ